jgi:hypothetical protein
MLRMGWRSAMGSQAQVSAQPEMVLGSQPAPALGSARKPQVPSELGSARKPQVPSELEPQRAPASEWSAEGRQPLSRPATGIAPNLL